MARALFGTDGEKEVGRALAALADAIRLGARPPPLSHVPEFLDTEMRNLHDSLVYVGRGAFTRPSNES